MLLSILIPTYNYNVCSLVHDLIALSQKERIEVEIIIGDDASTKADCIQQNDALEHDDREGLVADYLDTLLPDNWNEMDVYDRLDYIRDAGDPTKRKGVILRETVSNMEIWVECFGRQKADMQRSDSYAITAIMMHFDDWEKTGKYMSSGIYGRQRVWQRKHGRKP